MREDSIEVRRRVFCAKNGHSRILTFCFGYHYCARCGDQVGDSLGGAYVNPEAVYPPHLQGKGIHVPNCPCKGNAKKLRRKDLTLVPKFDSGGVALRPPWKSKKEVVDA